MIIVSYNTIIPFLKTGQKPLFETIDGCLATKQNGLVCHTWYNKTNTMATRLPYLHTVMAFNLPERHKLHFIFKQEMSRDECPQKNWSSISNKVAKIRNRYNQVPHLAQDTNGKVTNSQKTPQTRAKRSALSQHVTTKHI